MPQTWSVSRDQTLHICERRYFFQYLAAARINSRDSTLREIAFLKKLSSFSMWKGNAFHSVGADYLRVIRRRSTQSIDNLIVARQDRMRREWEFSDNRCFRSNPRAIDRDGGLALFEHEYDEYLSEIDLEIALRDVEKWARQFALWAVDSGLADEVRSAAGIWIEPQPFGPRAPGFDLDGVQVLTKVDLALQSPDMRFDIFDWKTGTPPSGPSRQIDHAQFQVSVYQLWPHMALGFPVDSIRAHLLYMSGGPVQRTFEIDQNLREQTLGVVRRSVARALHFQALREREGLGLADLDFAALPWACKRCQFKRICKRDLENDEG